MFTQSTHSHLSAQIRPTSISVPIQGARPPRRRISRRPPATPRKKCGLAAGKMWLAVSRSGKLPQNVRLKVVLPRDVKKLAITVQSLYDHAVKLRCCIKIGKSQKIIFFRPLREIDFHV